MSNSLMH